MKSRAVQSQDQLRKNSQIHLLFVRQDFDLCLQMINEVLEQGSDQNEFPIYTKAMILRQQGMIEDSLELFQQALTVNPHSIQSLKQVGRTLYLLGKRQAALKVYCEVICMGIEEWETYHNLGLCYAAIQDYENAQTAYNKALDIGKHDATYHSLAQLKLLQNQPDEAAQIYEQCIDVFPTNVQALTQLGLLQLRYGQSMKAFEYLGAAMSQDPRNIKTILAAGAVMQDYQDMDVALMKYRVAAQTTPNLPQLWNNVGMCYFGKQDMDKALVCLKRSLYLGPFEWITCYNLGLLCLNMSHYAAAFHYLSAAVNLKPDFAFSYMYLAVALSNLDDYDNACCAYDKAISLEQNFLFNINYAITLYKYGNLKEAKHQFSLYQQLAVEQGENSIDQDVKRSADDLNTILNSGEENGAKKAVESPQEQEQTVPVGE